MFLCFIIAESNPNTEKLLGFSLVVSNTTDRNKGVVCYKDTHHTKWTIPASFDIRCPVIGQYVMYYNERLPGSTYPAGYSQHAQFAVCEIEVYGKFHFNYFKQELFLFFSVLKFFFLNSLHVKMTQSLQFNQKLCLCFLRVLSNISININTFKLRL